MGIPRLMVACVALFACTAQANVRLAVIGDGPAQKAGLTDLLTAAFKAGDGIELVEREKLELVINEQSIQAMVHGPAARERIGGLVAADFLALVTANDREIRLAVCDVPCGLKLADFTLPANTPDAATTLSKQTAVTVNRFRAGVTHVAVVPDFVCRDLAFDRNYQQSDLAEVVRTQYRLVPGMALVAIDEARSIAEEREVSGAAGKAVFAPVFVEASYRTARGDAGCTVAITLTARDNAGKPLVERALPAVAIDEAGPALLKVLTQDLLPLTRPAGEPAAVDVEGQFKQLVAQADAFAQWGQWSRSAALREAALLLKPDADEQRIRLIREYSRHNDRPFEQWPKAARMQAGDSFREGVVQQCIADWRRSLSHCEFLVRNQRISREEATGLAWDAVGSVCGVRVADAEKLGDCERLKKDFVREVFVRIVSLPPATRGKLPGTGGAGNAPGFRMEAAFGDVTADGKYVWAACQYGRGLEIFDYQGQHLATIGKDAGLPEANQYGFFVHAVAPGRVLAPGTFGNEYRGWVAIVSFDGSRSTVDVILEAARARDRQAADNYSIPDPTLGFRPEGILVRMPEKPGATQYAYVLRDRFTPLVVDVAARKVWAYPWDERDRDAWSWVSGEHTPEHQQQRALMLRTVDVASGIVPPQKATDAWRIGRPLRPGSLAQVGDWV